MRHLIGLDVGTTAVKAGLLADDGRMVAVAAEEYRLDHPAPDRAELHAELYWHAAASAIGRAMKARTERRFATSSKKSIALPPVRE